MPAIQILVQNPTNIAMPAMPRNANPKTDVLTSLPRQSQAAQHSVFSNATGSDHQKNYFCRASVGNSDEVGYGVVGVSVMGLAVQG